MIVFDDAKNDARLHSHYPLSTENAAEPWLDGLTIIYIFNIVD